MYFLLCHIHRTGNKEGQYFAGNFTAADHSAVDNLLCLRNKIDSNITFWKMSPEFYAYTGGISSSIRSDLHSHEYIAHS